MGPSAWCSSSTIRTPRGTPSSWWLPPKGDIVGVIANSILAEATYTGTYDR